MYMYIYIYICIYVCVCICIYVYIYMYIYTLFFLAASDFREYADLICRRVKFFGLVVDTVNLSHTVSLADALDAAANRGLLYAIIVTSQHELHRSVTLTILHGQNPRGKIGNEVNGGKYFVFLWLLKPNYNKTI